MNRNILYITYDGLLDPLGQSQIIPYTKNIALNNNSLHILSFEKRSRFANLKEEKREIKNLNNFYWRPQIFTENFGFLGKIYDLSKMFFSSSYLIFFKKIVDAVITPKYLLI